MNQYFNMKIARQSAKMLDIIYLIIHIWFLYYFFSLGAMIMFFFNIFSVFTYTLGYWIVSKYRITTFIYLSSFEIWAHMILATICVGSGCGFQWILLFQPVELFFAEYFSLEIKGKTAHARSGSTICFFGFIALELYMNWHAPIYQVPEWVKLPTRISVICIVFVMALFLLNTFTKYAYLSERKLHEKAVVDGLTGLYNRFEVMDELENRLQRKELDGAWAAMIDLDNFKNINEKYGRSIGDSMLMQVAEILRGVEGNVVCARWGGDEFMICGFDPLSQQYVGNRMEEVRKSIEGIRMDVVDKEIRISATVGISFYREGGSIQDWVNTADKKILAGKYNGKNRVVR